MAKEKQKNPAELTVEEKLKHLYALQTMLSEIDKIKTLRGELPLEVQDLEDEIEGLTTRIEKIQTEIKNLKIEVAERKKTIQEDQANIARYEEQLKVVRNNREYDSLNKEIEFQQLDVELCEKKIREAEETLQHKKEEVAQCTTDIADRRADLEIKKGELDEIISETKAEEEKLRDRARATEANIDPRLLAAFKRIRKNSRNGLGVVYVQRDACGGCFNKIPPQRQLDIRMRKKIIVCEYCGRIMVDPELAGVEVNKPAEEKSRSKRVRPSARKKAAESQETAPQE
ncbi:MAG: C4-type zinc ribbon domain-containing protein [Prevotellaceae bacterium]|nr:C4-type zinc ribbon domain-containing protein [Prevotellaceae bacterium]